MQLFKFLKIIFGLPAFVRCGITVASQHCNCINVIQLKRCTFKHAFILFSVFIITQKINAQTADTNYVDTTSMANIDSSIAATTYDDENDGYVDTTIKHIYDTSQYFFNWKQNS